MSSNTPTDQARLATDHDILSALIALDGLPRRETSLSSVHLAAFRVAMEGNEAGRIVVAQCDLAHAVRKIIQGALGHAFHPSPPELRMWCNAARDERCEQVRIDALRKRTNDQLASRRRDEPSDEAKARVAELVAKFKRGEAVR